MVAGTNEEWAKRMEEEMSDFDRQVAGAFGSKNLRIPMTSAVDLRRVADIMAGLATELNRLSRRGDLSTRSIIIEAQWLVSRANHAIRTLPGKGSYRKSHDDPLPIVNIDSIHRRNTRHRRTKVAKNGVQETGVE